MPSVPVGKRWVTFAKPVVQGAEHVLEYLGRYVHKTAMGNRAVIACDETTVTFRYTDSRDHQQKRMTLPANEFLRRFLQHVPAKGFHRVRCFGLLQSNHRARLRQLQLLLARRPREHASSALRADNRKPGEPRRLRCPHCGRQELVLVRRLSEQQCRTVVAELELALQRSVVVVARAPPHGAGPRERAA